MWRNELAINKPLNPNVLKGLDKHPGWMHCSMALKIVHEKLGKVFISSNLIFHLNVNF